MGEMNHAKNSKNILDRVSWRSRAVYQAHDAPGSEQETARHQTITINSQQPNKQAKNAFLSLSFISNLPSKPAKAHDAHKAVKYMYTKPAIVTANNCRWKTAGSPANVEVNRLVWAPGFWSASLSLVWLAQIPVHTTKMADSLMLMNLRDVI